MTSDHHRELFAQIKSQMHAENEIERHYAGKFEDGQRDFYKTFERAVYRCKNSGCLLLMVWDAPEGTLVFRPAHKLSPGLNAESSNAAGRANHTHDGDRHWTASVGKLDPFRHFAPEGGISVDCRHVHRFIRAAELVDAVDYSRTGKPTRVLI